MNNNTNSNNNINITSQQSTTSSNVSNRTLVVDNAKSILSMTTKSGFFLKNLRRRSKTYSGEEFKAQLDKKLNDQKLSVDNRSEPRLKALSESKKRLIDFFLF